MLENCYIDEKCSRGDLTVISREEAKALGLKRYFLGSDSPCINGHVSERTVSSRGCLECSKVSAKNYAEKNREKILKRKREVAKTDEFKEKRKKWRREFYQQNKEVLSSRHKEYYINNKEKLRSKANDWYSNNKELVSLRNKEYRNKNREKILVKQAKWRALKAGVPFDLEPEDITIPDTCPVLGILLEIGPGGFHPNSATIDRFIPELGYVKGNVEVISFRANGIKSDATFDEIQKVLDWMKSRKIK